MKIQKVKVAVGCDGVVSEQKDRNADMLNSAWVAVENDWSVVAWKQRMIHCFDMREAEQQERKDY